MAKVNNIEAEVDAIRDKIYEETKHLSREEQNKRLQDRVQKAAAQFGFTIIPSAHKKPKTPMEVLE